MSQHYFIESLNAHVYQYYYDYFGTSNNVQMKNIIEQEIKTYINDYNCYAHIDASGCIVGYAKKKEFKQAKKRLINNIFICNDYTREKPENNE